MSTRAPVFQLPSLVSPPTPLHIAPALHTQDSPASGQFLQQQNYAWIVRKNLLSVFGAKTGDPIAYLRVKSGWISSVHEFKISRAKSLLLLVIATDNHHVLAAYHPHGSIQKRAVIIPHKITAVCPISSHNLTTPGLFSQSVLTYFSGIVAVGCKEGHVYVVDLALGSKDMMKASISQPVQLYFLDPTQGSVGAQVLHAVEAGTHACLEITANAYQDHTFAYCYREGAISKVFPAESILVSSLNYVPQLCSLLIGFNFGSFQIFSLSQLSLQYGSPCTPNLSPVIRFTYQEPENDPRGFVYVWAARGATSLDEGSAGLETKITLYQLVYESKVRSVGQQRILYQNLQTCAPRFEYALTPTPSRPNPRTSVGTRLLHCYTLQQHHRGGRGLEESHDESALDLTISVFIWSGGPPDGRQYFIGLFDINQWYHAQMPRILQWRMSGRHTGVLGCSYFAFFSLNPLLEANSVSSLLDVVFDHVSFFSSLPPVPETHTWPTALAFTVWGLTDDSIVSCKFYGLQRKALQELSRSPGLVFAEPQRLFAQCEVADLLGQGWEHSSEHTDLSFQQKALLSVALDHGLIAVLLHCAQTWQAGTSDCEPSLMVEWVRQKMGEISGEKDYLCAPLFNGSAHMDTSTLSCLRRLKVMLQHLSRLLHLLLLPASQTSDAQIDAVTEELLGHYRAAVVNGRLLEVITWCIQNKLLPLTNDSSISGYFSYPSTELIRMYDLLGAGQEPHKLAVDHLTEELWEGTGEEFSYPSNTFDEFLAIYTNSNILAQHCLMVYFLCDLESLAEGRGEQDHLVSSYGRVFLLPHQLTAFSRGLWCLDHQQFKEALRLLVGYAQRPWFFWQHSVVLAAFLRSGCAPLAIRYMHSYDQFLGSIEEVKLKISVYIAAGFIPQAVEIVEPFHSLEPQETFVEIFTYFLDQCYQTKQLKKIVELPLEDYEEELLVDYLEDHPSITAQELLVAFFLQRHRFVEAQQMHEKIKPLARADPDPKVRERSSFREILLAGYSRCIPAVLRDLPSHPLPRKEEVQKTFGELPPSQPLSKVLAREAQGKPRSQAALICAIMENVTAARSSIAEPLTPFRKMEEPRISDLGRTPFLSTPLTVRKARLHLPSAIATPLHVPSTPSHTPLPEPTMLTDFRTIMQSFHERLANLHQSGSTSMLDTSEIRTPFAKLPRSVKHTPAMTKVVTPPSILKVRHTAPPPVTKEEEEATAMEGGEDGGQEQTSTEREGGSGAVGPTPRRIRFAVEGTPIVSPGSSPVQDRLAGRMPTPYAPPTSSPSPLVMSTHLAITTPLPLSDDSELFLSPVESPSQLTPTPPPPQLPKKKLFTETESPEEPLAIDGDEHLEEKDESEKVEEEEEEESIADRKEAPVELEDTLQEEEEEEMKQTPTEPSRVPSRNNPLKEFSVKLTREGISSMAKGQTVHTPAPLTPQMSASVLPKPLHPSPLVTHARTATPFLATSSTKQPRKPGLLTPVLVSELLEAKKKQLQSSLEAIRRKDVAQVRALSPPMVGSVSIVKNQPSATVVRPPPREEEISVVASPFTSHGNTTAGISAPSTTQFGFSLPMTMSPPPVEGLQREFQQRQETPVQEFVFSPPLTRSQARRQRERHEREIVVQARGRGEEEEEEEEEGGTSTSGVSDSSESAVTGQRQTRRSRKSGRQSSAPPTQSSHEEVALVTPPAGPPHGREEQRQRRARPVKTSVTARRSTRLLRDRK